MAVGHAMSHVAGALALLLGLKFYCGAWAPDYCVLSDRCKLDSELRSGDYHEVTQITVNRDAAGPYWSQWSLCV